MLFCPFSMDTSSPVKLTAWSNVILFSRVVYFLNRITEAVPLRSIVIVRLSPYFTETVDLLEGKSSICIFRLFIKSLSLFFEVFYCSTG
jgi:hypothetical protein